MKNLVLLCLFMASSMFAQVVIKDRIITGNEPAVQATESITIKPTTWIKSGAIFHAYITDYINTPYELPNLTAAENYVFTRVYQKPMTTAVGDLANLQGLYVKDFTESISYFDGLGRAKQSIEIQQSPTKGDIVTHIAYDNLGRQNEEYLPYAVSSNNGGIIPGDIALATQNYYKTKYSADFANVNLPINVYSKKEFDNSPLNRVLKQAAPGQSWRLGGGHEIELDYQSNTATEVRQYYVTTSFSNNTYIPVLQLNTSVSANNGYYKANELYKTITKDENHTGVNKIHTTEEFKNKQGQVVLKRTYITNTITADTYYVYNDFGNLTYVLPPKSEAQLAKPSATSLSELCYQYKYDHRNRLVEKKIPGKGIESIVYDKLDRPVLTQDKIQQASRKWLFTKYDILGRVVYTGIYTHGTLIERNGMQSHFDNLNKLASKYYEEKIATVGSLGAYYSNNNFPITGLEVLTVNYYDDYNFNRAGAGLSVNNIYGVNSTTRLKGLATGNRVKILDTSNKWITTVSYYDDKSRTIYVYSKNDFLESIDIVESNLDFVGRVKEFKTIHKKAEKADVITVDGFEYDHASRLLKQTQKINNENTQLITANTYDDLGQLQSKKIGNTVTKPLQKVDYKYNVRGWLKNINEGNIITDNDLFNFTINYNNPQNGATPLFNGNISETKWKTTSDNVERWYKYGYDPLNRITSAIDNTGEYNVGNITPIEYDLNGNIQKMQRKRVIDADDNFTYNYDSGNKLQSLSGSKTGSFTYDVNGNMKTDTRKGITNITYNHFNLPTRVDFGIRRIEYKYDASGTKLQKKKIDGSNVTTVDYAGNYIYENNTLQYFGQPEGYVQNNNGVFSYVYQYKDHLGSVRLTYADSNNDGVITASTEIIEEENYFPFGARHKGYNSNVSSNGNSLAQKIGFNGKELNDDLLGGNRLDWYDFGARNYDADLGRWMNLDPLSEKYFDSSPYHYAANNPVFYVDPDGKQIYVSDILKKNKKGEYVNKDLAQAFLTFAKTDLGKEILGMFAGAGQKIEGTDIEFKEAGVFHQQGINLHVRPGDTMNNSLNEGDNGVTKPNLNPITGKGGLHVFINSKPNMNNEYAKNYKDNPDDPKAKQLYILSRTGTIFHETIIHAVGPAKDFTDDCKINCSDVRPSIRNSSNNSSRRRHIEGQKKGSMFYNKGIPAMQKLHKKQKSGMSPNKVKSTLKDYTL